MSASADNFFFARQTGGWAPSSARGVRAFLLDLHYGGQIQSIVRTDFLSPADRADVGLRRSRQRNGRSLDRLLALAGAEIEPKHRKVYLCHLYCELGATLAKDEFSVLHDYLRVNRNEVVILVLEDHVTPEDAVAVLEASHLADRAYTWVPGTPPPTLRQMIKKKKNVLIMAEHHGGVRPWYQAGYGRHPAGHAVPVRLDRQAGGPGLVRAGPGAHERAALPRQPLARHRCCPTPTTPPRPTRSTSSPAAPTPARKRRKRQPTILAVDFYSRGDLMREVDHLNGIAVPGSVLATAGA